MNEVAPASTATPDNIVRAPAPSQRAIRDADLGRKVELEDFRRAHRGDNCECRGSCEERFYQARKPTEARLAGRNEKCRCGSGKKTKKCGCGGLTVGPGAPPALRLCPKAIKEFARHHMNDVIELLDALHWRKSREPAPIPPAPSIWASPVSEVGAADAQPPSAG